MWIAVSAANGRNASLALAPSGRTTTKPCPMSMSGHHAPWQVGKSRQASTA